MQEKHILEYIKGHLSPEERQHINDWIRSDINNQKSLIYSKQNTLLPLLMRFLVMIAMFIIRNLVKK